ncbi:oxysterol-binding protein-related protein 11-like [Eucyclogobius newberryi]|uniref:oxysterol-binding protein-related protein 11-like n=1 Tax=Eucyclogobius newberryi TaxID=166745 RepID=UPI003B59ADD5
MAQSPGEPQKTPRTSLEPQPRRRPLSGDEDLLLFKTPPTLSCLGQCLSLFHQNLRRTRMPTQNHLGSPGPEPDSPTQNHLGSSGPEPDLPTQNHLGSPEPDSPPPDRAPSLGQPRPAAALNHVEPGAPFRADHSPVHRPGRGPSCRQTQGRTRADSPGCSGPPSEKHQTHSTAPPVSNSRTARAPAHCMERPDMSDDVTDTEDNEEEELGVLDEQRSIIIHLLSQLKLGMDLTRVVLPTFILEKRSLLEMYANFLSHPDMFLSITAGCSPEDRMVRVLEYYLTSFHEGRKGAVAKKPYNPVLGEAFHCSWSVPRDRVRPLRQPSAPGQSDGGSGMAADCYRVRFVAEQVSHHPPVSGFYCECPEKRVCVNAHVWTRSKFMGVSVGVSMVGEGVLHLLEHGEQYVFTLPCAYARSILTVPWVELGGKVSISCAQTGYSASVTFHTKPFYGGKVHRVTAEVRHDHTGAVVCRAQGEWNGVLEFTHSNGESKVMDTHRLPVTRKRLRAVDKQSPHESRRLWQHVTEALKAGNMEEATEHKRHLEERQRNDERQRAATKTPWTPKHFTKQGDGWVYNRPLWETH